MPNVKITCLYEPEERVTVYALDSGGDPVEMLQSTVAALIDDAHFAGADVSDLLDQAAQDSLDGCPGGWCLSDFGLTN